MASPGLHHEVLLKMRAKRDAKLEGEILAWIAEITGETIPQNREYESVLKVLIDSRKSVFRLGQQFF